MKPATTYKRPEDHVYLDVPVRDTHHKLIIGRLMSHFGVAAGDKIVEVGSGSGRYTDLMLDMGLKVAATEPDAVLAQKLRARLDGRPGLDVHEVAADNLDEIVAGARLVCGYHVLHHLDERTLLKLRETFEKQAASNRNFAGWFFLEPNPVNPLWVISVIITPGTTLSEERGVWRWSYYDKTLGGEVKSMFLGAVGLFPPRPFVAALPDWAQRIGSRLAPIRDPFHIYAVYGDKTR